jgi:hypothetical protein
MDLLGDQLTIRPIQTGWDFTFELYLVLAMVPVLDPAGFIGLRGNSLTPSKIDDFLSTPSHYGYKY